MVYLARVTGCQYFRTEGLPCSHHHVEFLPVPALMLIRQGGAGVGCLPEVAAAQSCRDMDGQSELCGSRKLEKAQAMSPALNRQSDDSGCTMTHLL